MTSHDRGVTAGEPTIIAAERVVTPDGVLAPGWMSIADGRIEAVGPGQPPAPADRRADWALPGFIDLHVHGGGGASFTEGGPDDARRAAAFHRAHGTTRTLASLVTAPLDRLERRVAMLAELADEGVIDGIHLEGPFLSAARCGAQDPRYLIDPDVAAFSRLQAASRGWLRMITIAPELPGAAAVIRAATAAGVIAAAGHTDASAEVTADAINAGISYATHLFNGMRPIEHRAPGPAGALLDRQVTCEIIADGTHLHDTIVRLAARAAGPGNLVLITDAMAAAGMPDGDYRLGELDVTVSAGVARLSGTTPGGTAPGRTAPGGTAPGRTAPGSTAPGRTAPGRTAPGSTAPGRTAPGSTASGRTAPGSTASGRTAPGSTAPGSTATGSTGAIAGSTATMELVVRRAITAIGLSVVEVAQAASTTPARRLGLDGVTGSLRAGLAADIVLLDSEFRLRAVVARGEIRPALEDGPGSAPA